MSALPNVYTAKILHQIIHWGTQTCQSYFKHHLCQSKIAMNALSLLPPSLLPLARAGFAYAI